MPLEELVLQVRLLQETAQRRGDAGDSVALSATGEGAVAAFLSQAMDPPHPKAVGQAVLTARNLGALDEEETLTELGRHLAHLPLLPRVGKMVLYGLLFRVRARAGR